MTVEDARTSVEGEGASREVVPEREGGGGGRRGVGGCYI